MDERCEPLAERHRLVTLDERQHLAIPPQRGLTIAERLLRPGSGGLEIVSGQQGSATGTEKMALARIERPSTAGPRALKVCEIRHSRFVIHDSRLIVDPVNHESR